MIDWIIIHADRLADLSAIFAGILLLIPLNDLRIQKNYYKALRKQQGTQKQTDLKKLEARVLHLEEGIFSINGWAVIPAGILLLMAIMFWVISSP